MNYLYFPVVFEIFKMLLVISADLLDICEADSANEVIIENGSVGHSIAFCDEL